MHSDDAVCVVFNGNPRRPEPSTGVIKFPGGHVEVSRCSDGTYWVHLETVAAVNIVDSRIEYEHGGTRAVRDLPEHELVRKLAIRVANTIPHP